MFAWPEAPPRRDCLLFGYSVKTLHATSPFVDVLSGLFPAMKFDQDCIVHLLKYSFIETFTPFRGRASGRAGPSGAELQAGQAFNHSLTHSLRHSLILSFTHSKLIPRKFLTFTSQLQNYAWTKTSYRPPLGKYR